eukprot:239160-Alexandrium_andersonii.AAC.1
MGVYNEEGGQAMHCSLTKSGAVLNIIVVHVMARADSEERAMLSRWIFEVVNTLGAEARVLIVGA